MVSTTESPNLFPVIRQKGEKDDKSPGTKTSRLLQWESTQIRWAHRCLLVCCLLSSLCYTFGGDLHAVKNLLVKSACYLVTALRQTAVFQCCETPNVQRCGKKFRVLPAKKSHLRQRAHMISALQLKRPKPYLFQEPRAGKRKLSVLCSSQCVQLGVRIKNKTIFTLPNRQSGA